jgi:IS5 family transposase
MAVADGTGLPLAVYTTSASPHEVKLAGHAGCNRFTDERPEKMIGDKAYDSDSLEQELAKFGIELIAPHKANRKKPKRRTAENCGVIKGVGKSKGCLRAAKLSVNCRA